MYHIRKTKNLKCSTKRWKPLVMIVMVLHAVLSVGYVQTATVTVQEKDKTIREVLDKIEQQTNLNFFYNDKDVDLSRKVNINQIKQPVVKVLQVLFENSGNSFKIDGNQVYLLKNPTKVAPNSPPTQDKLPVKGRISDENGEGIAHVSVSEKGTANGTYTDEQGNYEITVSSSSAILVYSYVGFLAVERNVGNNALLNVVLEEDIAGLEEVVVVGFGEQKKESVTAAIASVSNKELVQTPQSNVSNMLVGRMPGLIAFQRSGAPGEDESNLLIRGVGTFTDNTQPLVMIDGVERPNFNGLDPHEIESVNILKDASATAIYGVRGANGVILITTRRGALGKPTLSYSGNAAVQQPTELPSYLGSYDYARLYNEALENDARVSGSPYIPRFTENDLTLYQNGFDPILHPDTDWINMFMRDFSFRTQHNFNINGGTERVKYFVSAGYMDQHGMYKHTQIDRDHDVNPRNTRYNFRSNLDFQVTDDFTATVQMAAQIEKVNTPASNNSSIWEAISHANPLNSPGLVDGKIVRIQDGLGTVNPWQNLLSNGYRTDNRNNINTTLRLDYDLSRTVTDGLAVHGNISYDSYYHSRDTYNRSYPYYLARRDDDDPNNILLIPQSEETVWSYGADWGKNRRTYMEFGINYQKDIGDHNMTGLLLYNQIKNHDPNLQFLVPNGYQGLVGRLTYAFQNRYMAEINVGYNGTENFAEGQRFGFFPAFSAGWIMSDELFFPQNDYVTFLKFRGSYGEVGNDRIGGDRFLYLPSSYGLASDDALNHYNFGLASNPYNSRMIIENKIGNPDLTWERARKSNIGIEANFLKNRLTTTFDFFREKRDNILANRASEPVMIGANLPAYNFGEMENQGWEMDINYQDNVGEFTYWARANYSFARNKIVFIDEVPQRYDYMLGTGRRHNQFFGLVFDGFYNSWEEINALDRPATAWSSNQLQPGDMRYVDVNQDGIIDQYDVVPIGHTPIPEIIYGISFGGQYKGFDFSALFQGANNVSIKYFGRAVWPFINAEESAKSLILERWTPERYAAGEHIGFPRLSLNPTRESDHNYRESEFWIRDASYLRLKNAEIGYTLSSDYTKRLGIGSVRVYVNGSNLFTWTDVFDVDPEAPSRSGNAEINTYPVQKVYNLGLNINF